MKISYKDLANIVSTIFYVDERFEEIDSIDEFIDKCDELDGDFEFNSSEED